MLLGSVKIEVALDLIRAFSVNPPQEYEPKETYKRALKLVESVINPDFEGMKERLEKIRGITKAVMDRNTGQMIGVCRDDELQKIYDLAGEVIEGDDDDGDEPEKPSEV